MFLESVTAILLGVIAGTITGLTPGLHINLLAGLLVAYKPALSVPAACFVVAMAVTHTFTDAVPSIFLGAPDPGTALTVLPGHRFLLKGQGFKALRLTLIGSLSALLLAALLTPLFVAALSFYPSFKRLTPYLLIAVSVFSVTSDKNFWKALTVFASSGLLGVLVLNNPSLKNPLLPLLSGLFGASTLLFSFKLGDVPAQAAEEPSLRRGSLVKALGSGCFSGFLTGVLPGIGSGIAALLSSRLARLDEEHFLTMMGSVNTFNFMVSLSALYAFGKPRNGAVVAVKELLGSATPQYLAAFVASSVIAGCVAFHTTSALGLFLSKKSSSMDVKRLNLSVLAFLTVLVFSFSGWTGLLVFATSSALGVIPHLLGVRKSQAMGCLVLPVLSWLL